VLQRSHGFQFTASMEKDFTSSTPFGGDDDDDDDDGVGGPVP